MGQARPLVRHHDRHEDSPPLQNEAQRHHLELDALRDENAELRELVIQLSKLVIKNVVDRK